MQTPREYKVDGRCLPTPKCPTPPLFRMRIFASNHVVTHSPELVTSLSQLPKGGSSNGDALTMQLH
uniref:Uncharacterized protein n=1 Tax=Chelonoidis abingdonii TaxID=106734 RepID=A0A8C0HGZ7_CHEAB